MYLLDTKFQRDIYYRHASGSNYFYILGSIAEAFFIHKNRERLI